VSPYSQLIGQAVERDTARPIRRRKSRILGTAFETDFALPMRPIVGSAVAALNALLGQLQRVGESVSTASTQHDDRRERDPVADTTAGAVVLIASIVGLYQLLRRIRT
jgi:hypothetical protein